MQSGKDTRRFANGTVRILGSILMLLIFFFSFRSSTALSATTRTTRSENITLTMSLGSQPFVKLNGWLPVSISVTNTDKSDFSGTINISTYYLYPRAFDQRMPSPQIFTQAITVPHGSIKRVVLNIPFNAEPVVPNGVLAFLQDNHGQSVDSKTKDINAPLSQGDLSIGVFSDRSDRQASFSTLDKLTLPYHSNSPYVTFLTADTFPLETSVLENFDLIILDDFATNTLSHNQIVALQTWVNQGGILLEVGGPDWQRTLSPLPANLLPVTITGTSELPVGTHLLSESGISPPQASGKSAPNDRLTVPVTISNALLNAQANMGAVFSNTAVLSYNAMPMLVQSHQGQGLVYYLAFDPAETRLSHWQGNKTFWTQLLTRAFGDQLLISDQSPRYNSGQGGLLLRGGILPALQPSLAFIPLTFILLLSAYIAILGPIRLLITRRARRAYWNWRILLSSVVIFSLLSYGVIFYQKTSSLTENSLSIIRVNQDGSAAHVTTYMGVFVPNQDTFKIHIPNVSQAQAIANPLYSSKVALTGEDSSTPINYGTNETTITLEDAGIWTYHPFVFEHDLQLHGRVNATLSLNNERLVGIVHNTLATPVNDVYVLIPHSFAALGNLAAGETRQVNVPLQSLANNPNTLLANQIAESSGLPASYFPYQDQGQPRSEFQRHIAQLSILSGAGFSFLPCAGSCITHAIVNVNKGTIVPSHTSTPKTQLANGVDPLLINGAPATLLGWAAQSLDGAGAITVNGNVPRGTHDTLLQEPIALNLTPPFNVPANLLNGQVVGAQGSGLEMVSSDLYTMSTGSMNFEFTLPNSLNTTINTLTMTMPNLLTGKTVSPTGNSFVRALFYNWDKATWEALPYLDQTWIAANPQAYISADGRVLAQISSLSTTQGMVYFSKPYLSFS